MTSGEINKVRADILALTTKYSELFLSKQTFTPGVDAIPVSGKVLESDDFVNLIDSSLDGWFTSGRYTKEFERSLADFVGRNWLRLDGRAVVILDLERLSKRGK